MTAKTTINESGLTWAQREYFHELVDEGMIECKAYMLCLWATE